MSNAERWATTMKTELLSGRGVDVINASYIFTGRDNEWEWADAATTEETFGWVREARTIAIPDYEALRDAISDADGSLPFRCTDARLDRMLDLDEVPFVSQPRVALPGWYQIDETLAITLWSTEVPNESEVWHCNLLAYMPDVTGNDPRIVILPARGEIWTKPEELQATVHACFLDPAQGDRARSSSVPVIPFQGDRLSDLLNWTLATMGVLLLVNTMVLLDPAVAVTTSVPPKVWAKSVKEHPHRVRSRTMTSIHLPGLRYDRKAGRWVGTSRHGVVYHWVRGFWRTLKSPRYGSKVGTRVYVHPHHRGDKSVGVSTRPYEVDSPT